MNVMIGRAFTRVLTSPRLRRFRRWWASLPRVLLAAPARVDFFHQLDDPYSHLLLQLLAHLQSRYRLQIQVHLVPAPEAAAAPERARLQAWSRRDAGLLAELLELQFDAAAPQPEDELLASAERAALAVLGRADALEQLRRIGTALWAGEASELQRRATAVSAEQVATALQAGAAVRRKRGHYLGATLYFEGEWYWGVDRLQHLEQRLRDAHLARGRLTTWLAAIPPIECLAKPAPGRQPQLHFYCSLRSPYTYLAVPRVRQLAAHYGARLHLRFVMPMAMRGLPVPLEKRLYIVRDAKREAERLGMRFGDIADPLGAPSERGLAVLHQAIALGRGAEFAESFLQGVFADGIDAGSDAGLRQLAGRAGLDAAVVAQALADPAWRAVAEANREEMFSLGLWGVPSFRLDHGPGYWGQDRLWLIERELIAATAEPSQ